MENKVPSSTTQPAEGREKVTIRYTDGTADEYVQNYGLGDKPPAVSERLLILKRSLGLDNGEGLIVVPLTAVRKITVEQL